ncbi:MAG TPA: hypothetical protein VGE27_02990 [Gemmatimonas sp.]|uniref:hypothetical protein n=1 Tax=Gemmatimonas sp. TaxID=1962908 RepID=UPI002ED82270
MTELLLLRLVHILSGTFWLGAAVVNAFFLMPAAMSIGPAGGALMLALRDRGMMHWLLGSSVLTLLSGIRLFWIIAGGDPGAFMASPMGQAFGLGGVAAILAFVLAMAVSRPAAVKIATLSNAMGSASEAERTVLQQEIARCKKRSSVGSTLNIVLLVGSAMGMAVARYL